MEYFGEQQEQLFLDQMEDQCEGHMDHTMKVIVTHEPTSEEDQVSIVIEGNKVLTRCGNRSRACMLLMGLIYALNQEYPKTLRNTFEVFQKLFLELDGAKLPKKVHSLKMKLLE
ncbi:unnamed protein product [Arctogadus glacialis]